MNWSHKVSDLQIAQLMTSLSTFIACFPEAAPEARTGEALVEAIGSCGANGGCCVICCWMTFCCVCWVRSCCAC